MIFTLEALKAAYGDALLLHFGTLKAPSVVVIDGGPSGVYRTVLRPRLVALMANKKRLVDGQLPLPLVMVSHIDDDHVNGVLELAKELTDGPGKKPFVVHGLWHNAFDDILGNGATEMAAALETAVRSILTTGVLPASSPLKHTHSGLVVASVRQGRELRLAAQAGAWRVNHEFGGKLVRAKAGAAKPIPIGKPGGLTFTVLGPLEPEIQALQEEWESEIKRLGVAKAAARAAEYADDSVFNLSSLVVLAEAKVKGGKKRRMLLTGDARGDHILAGLTAAKLMKDGKCHVDLLKLPHHGSDRNMEEAFFRTVTADHYVVSSNGERFDNPDAATLKWLVEARSGGTPFTVYLTYPVSEFKFKKRTRIQSELQAFIDTGRSTGAYKVICREPGAPSVRVDLGDELLAD